MNRDDVIKFIDGKVFYYSDYINFLYKQLELKDNIIKEVREILNQDKASASFNTAERKALEILDKENK